MKTIEEKAKAYDEALKVLHKYDGANIMFSQSLKEEMFPELKESEGERISREITDFIIWSTDRGCITKEQVEKSNSWLAWLDKQGEQKPLTVDIKSMVDSYEQRLINQCNGVRNSPIVNMCVTAFKHGVENTLDELHLKQASPVFSNSSNNGKNAWSEEDEDRLEKAIFMLKEGASRYFMMDDITKATAWLKSLKDRVK